MEAASILRSVSFAAVLALLSCGQELPGVQQPGPDALSPDTSAGGGSVAALPLPRGDAEPLAVALEPPAGTWLTAGLGSDLGLVVWSGVNPQDDRPTAPPDDVRDQ